ncbi:MAG: hypothetical protein J6Q58_04400 [Clostridia bacterium]|nr:hypothetical protein [Clostridia bacterium]
MDAVAIIIVAVTITADVIVVIVADVIEDGLHKKIHVKNKTINYSLKKQV